LIIALVFIVVVAVIVGAISSLAMNDLNNTTHFNTATATSNALTDIANLAIQSERYAPTPDKTLGTCGVSSQTFNQENVAITCESISHPGSSQSRDVTMYACLASTSNCNQNPLLTLVEAYDDYSASGTDTCLTNPSQSTCGFGASTLVWTWGSLTSAVGGLIPNTITITSTIPTSASVGTQLTPTATTTSGDPVTITPGGTDSPCTVTNGTVFFNSAGVCTLDFNDPGNFNYAPAPELIRQITLS
jgi:hypothetical protein